MVDEQILVETLDDFLNAVGSLESEYAKGCRFTVNFVKEKLNSNRLSSSMPVGDVEKVAKFMLSNGFATGHGDSVDDLLNELDWQIKELRATLPSAPNADMKVLITPEWLKKRIESDPDDVEVEAGILHPEAPLNPNADGGRDG